jgi:hypothetical protein
VRQLSERIRPYYVMQAGRSDDRGGIPLHQFAVEQHHRRVWLPPGGHDRNAAVALDKRGCHLERTAWTVIPIRAGEPVHVRILHLRKSSIWLFSRMPVPGTTRPAATPFSVMVAAAITFTS